LPSDQLTRANLAFAAAHPGDAPRRQPVHTVYGGAQLFRHDIAARLGAAARQAFEAYVPDPEGLARAIGASVDDPLVPIVHSRIAAKLAAEPVEDFRIDFEDGYGTRPDVEEDGHAKAAGAALARGVEEGTLPPCIGLRVKPLTEELRARSERTLTLVLDALLERTGGRRPPWFVVTLPKITVVEQVRHFADTLGALETRFALPSGTLQFELMVETPQSIMGADGRCPLRDFVAAGGGRVTAAHFGTYDYTASLGITAGHQRMRHPACDFARQVMQVALAGSGIWLSDGSTAVLPVPPVRPGDLGLTSEELTQNRASMQRAWRLHYDDVIHSLTSGFYQGWDLHPAQLVTRYAACYMFFLSGMDTAGARLRNFVEKAAQATLLNEAFDDAATGQGLLNFFLRAINCGAISEEDTARRTGLTLDDLRARSFSAILRRRTRRD
jgi:citrate lyase beta subunit